MVQGNIVLLLLILMLSIRVLPIFRLRVRLNQLILFKWLWYYFSFGRWAGGICVLILFFFKGISNISLEENNCSVPFICFLFQKHGKKVKQIGFDCFIERQNRLMT